MGKLVQDLVPDLLGSEALRIAFAKADPSQRRHLLFAKLLEEAGEWLSASNPEDRLKELTDMQMVLRALAELDAISPEQAWRDAISKLAARGGYQDMIVMTVEGADTPPAEREQRSQPTWVERTPDWAPAPAETAPAARAASAPAPIAPMPTAAVPAAAPPAPAARRDDRNFWAFDGPGYSG